MGRVSHRSVFDGFQQHFFCSGYVISFQFNFSGSIEDNIAVSLVAVPSAHLFQFIDLALHFCRIGTVLPDSIQYGMYFQYRVERMFAGLVVELSGPGRLLGQIIQLSDQKLPPGCFNAVVGIGQRCFKIYSGAIIHFLFIKPECLHFIKVVLETFREGNVIFKGLDQARRFSHHIAGNISPDLPDKGFVPTGRSAKRSSDNTVFFFCGYTKCVCPFIGITSYRYIIAISFFRRKSIIDILESKIGRVQVVAEIIGFSNQHKQVVYPGITQVVRQDTGIRLINDRVQLCFVGGGMLQAIIVEGKQLCKIVLMCQFCGFNDLG